MIYALNYQCLNGAFRPITGFYFSFITQLTIGYGDVSPKGWLRLVVVLQGLIGFLFVVSVLVRAIAALPPVHMGAGMAPVALKGPGPPPARARPPKYRGFITD